MKILITGGTGFVGTNLTNALGVSYGKENVFPVGRRVLCGSMTNSDAFDAVMKDVMPDVLIHAAGFVGGIEKNANNPGLMIRENLAMGIEAVDKAFTYGVKLIILGTVCAYPKFTPVPFKEEDLWNGYPEETNAPYGIAKKSIMKLAEAYHEQFGLNVVNLIPVNMYGPHDHFNTTTSHVIPALILKVLRAKQNNEPLSVWGDGSASREFLHVDDFSTAVERAIESNPGPEPINIGSGKEITIKDLVKKICRLTGFDGLVNWDISKPNGQPRRCLDTTKAKDRLNFEAQTDLELGLAQTIQWFKNHNGENI